MNSCQCTADTNVNNTHLAIPIALSGLSPAGRCLSHAAYTQQLKQLLSGMCYLWRVYCRARLGVIFPMDHIMLGWQSSVFRASVQYPSTSVCISWHAWEEINNYHLS